MQGVTYQEDVDVGVQLAPLFTPARAPNRSLVVCPAMYRRLKLINGLVRCVHALVCVALVRPCVCVRVCVCLNTRTLRRGMNPVELNRD